MKDLLKEKTLLKAIGFRPKNDTEGIYIKKYPNHKNCTHEVDFLHQKINYDSRITLGSATTQNFSQAENWVVLECVNRLLEKGYKPESITLEKTYPTGHKTSGRLDILVKKNAGAYLMIECKTWGKAFEKAQETLKNDTKCGGQLFTYFQQDTQTKYLMLYASRLYENRIEYKNDIIKIEEDYRQASNVKDLYERWNKIPKQNGIFDHKEKPYAFKSKALLKKTLHAITQEDSSFIFHRFLSILRQHVVSDKPNAFNKIFTLFLCKIVDENKKNEEKLGFQWLEGEDDNISFMKRLTDLYKEGMKQLLQKEVTDVGDEAFNKKFKGLEKDERKNILELLTNIRLKKNNEFAFKEVFDDESFEENTKVVKDVVELLQTYQLRYNEKHPYLGDFFELLLTTGLKQESGQFFTPVPIARYIIKSLPIKEIIKTKFKQRNAEDLLPHIIDYAAGSGHFLTESMDEVQQIINDTKEDRLTLSLLKKVQSWKNDQFDWASTYVYGIEKDYRLVKTSKVNCFLHGDGLAKVIHGDGLATFGDDTPYYKNAEKLKIKSGQDNKQFDIVIANPPYSVSAFKGSLNEKKAKEDFELFGKLTDQSREIETLFIERTKQLLKDGGVAGIILPSSVLSNTGIYTSAREIILKYFELIGITQLGSATFMATGTNTVVLFLRRKNDFSWSDIKNSVEKFLKNLKDITVNGIENIFSSYVAHVWGNIHFSDYISLCKKEPNKAVCQHEIYQSYSKKLKTKDKESLHRQIIAIEKEKLLYFILAYKQKIVLTNTGIKKEEKQFLGYEFSTRRGHEGIHSIQRDKSIDACTQLFDPTKQANPKKANYYIYKNFLKEDIQIDASLEKNISMIRLTDMMTFDRVGFEKTISLFAKKKVAIESNWEIFRIKDLCEIGRGRVINKKEIEANFGKFPVYSSQTSNNGVFGYLNTYDFEGEYATWTTDGIYAGRLFYRNGRFNCTNVCGTLKAKSNIVNMKYLALTLQNYTDDYVVKVANPKLMNNVMAEIKIPLPPKKIQEKIVQEIEVLEKQEVDNKEKIEALKESIQNIIEYKAQGEMVQLGDICKILNGYAFKSNKYVKSGMRIIRISNVQKGDIIDKFPKFYLRNDNYYEKYRLRENDLLISLTGNVGRVGLLPKKLLPAYLNQRVACLRVYNTDYVSVLFLYFLLNSSNFEKTCISASHGIAQKNLSTTWLLNHKMPFPPKEIQEKIVQEITTIEEEIITLQADIKEAKKQKEAVLGKYL